MRSVDRAVIDSLLPEGPIWEPEIDEGLDQYFQGKADNSERVADFLECLACIRDPYKTPILSDLEKEHGILTNLNVSEEDRRNSLAQQRYRKKEKGSWEELQVALRAAGFDVYVHENSPAVDPALFLAAFFRMIANGPAAFAGNEDAFAGKFGGELLVNGDIFTQSPAYVAQANGATMFAGNQEAFAGNFDSLNREKIEYSIPSDPDSWPFVFFVGGMATRDPSTGELTQIDSATIPSERESEFKRIILQRKPLFTWAGLLINYM
jgi:hypothetical protein